MDPQVQDKDKIRLQQGLGVGVQALGMAGTIADAVNPMNEYGRQSMATNVLKNAGTFGAMGAQFGPIGAGVGVAAGIVKGIIDGNKQRREEERIKNEEAQRSLSTAMERYSARAAADPSIAYGVQGGSYFENGGPLFRSFITRNLKGGSLSHLSSDTVEAKGRSHAQGGIVLPNGDEIEDGETIKGNYVLSDKLGFAQAHKPIAKAIGILEKKAPTESTLNSLERLREKEQALILFQEEYRKRNNLA